MRLAYFVNQYPKVSHSFIRREIQALEKQGIDIVRIALRSDRSELADAKDLEEFEKTKFVLQLSPLAILKLLLTRLFVSPTGWFRALGLALNIGWGSERGVLRHMAYFIEACVVANWAKAHNAQHIHAHFGTNSAAVVMLVQEMGGPPYSFTVHGPEEFDKPVFISLGEKIIRSAFVVAISSYGRSQLLRWIDFDQRNKVKVIHCGLDDAFHHGDIPVLTDVPHLLCIGRLCEQKGQLLLLEAVHKLAREGTDFQLVFAGDGPLRREVDRLIAHYDLESRVRVTGWISSEDVRREILNARALVLPSFAEGLPVVLMEAMALKRPVLSTYVAGIPELVIPGENGWLVPPGHIDQLQKAIGEVLTAPVERLRDMGEKARQRVLDRHNVDREATKLAELFRTSQPSDG